MSIVVREMLPSLHHRLFVVAAIYDGPMFDLGHDRRHMRAVRRQAGALARVHDEDVEELAEVAAVYHDVGLQFGRDDHEVTGAQFLLDDPVLPYHYNDDARTAMADAVLHHRASTGNPETVLAKIVADADRTPVATAHAYMRAYAHGELNHPELGEVAQLRRAANHLWVKCGPDGYGRRTHFPETEARIQEVMQPIFDLGKADDLEGMRRLLRQEGYVCQSV
jgi:uncharacterized protein